jgi:hypothetical protein
LHLADRCSGHFSNLSSEKSPHRVAKSVMFLSEDK